MFPCANCGASIDAELDGECDAPRCGMLQCMYCGTPWFEECEHLLSYGPEPCEAGVFDYGTLPFLDDDALASAQWSDSQLAKAFGDAAVLLEAYNEDLSSPPSDVDLANLMREQFGIPLHTHIFQHAGMGGGGITIWSSDPLVARPQAENLLQRLHQGFVALGAMPPGGAG